MAGFEVQPGELGGAGARQSLLAGELRGLRGQLERAGSNSAAAGDPDLCAALEGCCSGWGSSLEQLGGAVEGLAANLAAAARAYEATDAGAMPEGG